MAKANKQPEAPEVKEAPVASPGTNAVPAMKVETEVKAHLMERVGRGDNLIRSYHG